MVRPHKFTVIIPTKQLRCCGLIHGSVSNTMQGLAIWDNGHMLPFDTDGTAVFAGRGTLIRHLKQRMVLVVIDDADSPTQLKNLLPPCKLQSESLVIITSRKKDVLDARCTYVSEVQLLPKGRDVELFQAWAFAMGPPTWDTSMVVPDIVACCGQLPLALKVGIAPPSVLCSKHTSVVCMIEKTIP